MWKPPGLPVFPPHEGDGPSVLSWWLTQPQYAEKSFPQGFEAGITHRLDTATSGLLIVARTVPALDAIRAAFASQELRKVYVFRSLSGALDGPALSELPIAHHPKSRRRMIVANPPHRTHRGRWYPAWTRFTRLGPDPTGIGWTWQAEIRTGVMHQIRVHAKHAGVPLLDDPLYGPVPAAEDSPGTQPASRFLLHHALVIFPGGRRSPVAPLPDGSVPTLHVS